MWAESMARWGFVNQVWLGAVAVSALWVPTLAAQSTPSSSQTLPRELPTLRGGGHSQFADPRPELKGGFGHSQLHSLRERAASSNPAEARQSLPGRNAVRPADSGQSVRFGHSQFGWSTPEGAATANEGPTRSSDLRAPDPALSRISRSGRHDLSGSPARSRDLMDRFEHESAGPGPLLASPQSTTAQSATAQVDPADVEPTEEESGMNEPQTDETDSNSADDQALRELFGDPDEDKQEDVEKTDDEDRLKDMGRRPHQHLSELGRIFEQVQPEGELPKSESISKWNRKAVSSNVLARDTTWPTRVKQWDASAVSHPRVYFEDTQLERYGNHYGRITQPAVSGLKFAKDALTQPIVSLAKPPYEKRYGLGYKRPGSPESLPFGTWRQPSQLLSSGPVQQPLPPSRGDGGRW